MKKLFITIVVILALAAAFFVLNKYIYQQKQVRNPQAFEPYKATLTGTYICLSTKDGADKVTCREGIKTEVGEFYALDFNLSSQTKPSLAEGVAITASGIITPIERLSSNQWQNYSIKGIFSVTNSVFVSSPAPEPSVPQPNPIAGKCYVGGCSAQICSDEPNMVSTCEYRAEYMCYKTATCERQTTGQCGWTQTKELQSCLDNAK